LGAGGREFESPHPDHIYQVSALLSSETAFFVIGNDGRFIEMPDCRR